MAVKLPVFELLELLAQLEQELVVVRAFV